MRMALLSCLALPMLLTHCGANNDLVIGILRGADGGAGATPNTGATAGDGGTLTGAAGSSGSGGAAGSAGSGAEGGSAGGAPEPGLAGAGGEGDGGAESCVEGEEPPVGSLVHRYDFSGTGTTLIDLVGGQDGTLQEGAMLDGTGFLTLPGRRPAPPGQPVPPDQYVDLPDGILSRLTDATLVVWATHADGGAGFQRIFDFGDSDTATGEGQGNQGRNYIALLYGSNFANGNDLGAQVAAPGFPSISLGSYFEMVEDVEYQLAVSYGSLQQVSLYAEASRLISSPVQRSLSELHDVNCWLGRSQWQNDHGYRGTYNEFRIYDAVLNSCQLATLKARGPDAP
jgi:hypothetical protein